MRNHTILVADDERSIRQYMNQELLTEGFDVVLTEDGAEALLVLDRFVVDLVVLDQHMPLCSGLETAKRIRQLHPSLPIVLFTADLCYENYCNPEVDASVMKSADLSTLKCTIAKLLAADTGTTHTPHTPLSSTWADAAAKCGG